MPDVAVKVSSEGKVEHGHAETSVGGEIELGFDPARARVKVDYSKQDSVVFTVEGEFSPPKLKGVTIGGGAAIALDGRKNFAGSVSWEIAKHVEAKGEVSMGSDGPGAAATLTIRF